MPTMRAKVRVSNVEKFESTQAQNVVFNAVAKNGGYPEDGSDENNTYAKWSPSAEFKIHIANPALYDKFVIGQEFYVDFTAAA